MPAIEDFSVLPGGAGLSYQVYQIYAKLEQSLKPKDISSRKSEQESDSTFLLRTAITAAEEGPALFRKNAKADQFLASTWLSIVKNKARAFSLRNDIKLFSPLGEDDLRRLARLSVNAKNLPLLPKVLADEFGVILVVEPSFQAMRTDGCVLTLDDGVPVIGLSLRYNRYDNFWFTLMHEMAHISLHFDYLSTPILDDLDEDGGSDVEVEANRLATDSLVPRNIWRKMVLHRNSRDHLEHFAEQAEIHPAIAAGLIRHREKNYAIYSDLVGLIDVVNELGVGK